MQPAYKIQVLFKKNLLGNLENNWPYRRAELIFGLLKEHKRILIISPGKNPTGTRCAISMVVVVDATRERKKGAPIKIRPAYAKENLVDGSSRRELSGNLLDTELIKRFS